MIVIHYPTAYKALDRFIDQYNEKAQKNADRLRTGAVMTAKEIIRIYGVSLLKANGCQQVNIENLPSLQTNNKQLAKLVKCSSRSIQRHILKLQSAGIITNKVFRGSNANYELLINPQILLIKERLPVDNAKNELRQALEQARKNEEKSNFLPVQKTKCPDTYSGNTGNINNLLIGVHNSKLSIADEPTGNRTGNTGEIVQPFFEKQKKAEEKNNEITGEIVSRAEKSGDKNFAPDPARDNSLNLYVGCLWLMARNLLYKHTDLTDRQVLIAKKLIHKFYQPVSTDNLSNIHQRYVERIALAAKYVQKDPEHRFIPLPYRYFDTNNPNGFTGTKKWHQAYRERKKEVERELILGRMIRKYQSNEKKEPAKKRPPIQLFRECENTIGKFNDPSLTERFHAAVLHHETYRQLK